MTPPPIYFKPGGWAKVSKAGPTFFAKLLRPPAKRGAARRKLPPSATPTSQLSPAPPERTLSMQDESSYICNACGEEIVVPIDFSAGDEQEYVEDCPVCCHPNIIHVELRGGDEVTVWAEPE